MKFADLKVGYHEPHDYTRVALTKCLTEFFLSAGLRAEIEHVRMADEVIERATLGAIDIFVCDLTLNRSSGELGLQVIADIKKHCPWLFCIAVSSAAELNFNYIDAAQRSFDMFIPKGELTGPLANGGGDSTYARRLANRFRYSGLRTYHIEADVPETDRGVSIKRAEMLPLIRQLFSVKLPVETSMSISTCDLKVLGGGRSASRVFVVNARSKDGNSAIQPCVMKISSLENAKEEARRYDTYVRWVLPQHVRVDLLSVAFTRSQGAVLYSFAHGGGAISTLRDLLECGDDAGATRALHRLCESIGGFWRPIAAEDGRNSLTARYLARYYDGKVEWFLEDDSKIRGFIRDHRLPIERDNHNTHINNKIYPSLQRTLQLGDALKTTVSTDEWSIIHGDLNPGNVIVSSTGEIALIDFRDSGIGHRYEDLVTFEGCLRMFWNWDDAAANPASVFLEALEEEALINYNLPPTKSSKGWSLCRESRNRISALEDRDLRSSFYFGLAYYCFRLMRISDLSPARKARILATAYSAIGYFAELEKIDVNG
jgi:aminoglycoside phosphotransferase